MKHKQDGKSGALTMSRVFNTDSLKMSINELDTFESGSVYYFKTAA